MKIRLEFLGTSRREAGLKQDKSELPNTRKRSIHADRMI
jgi:hypothetical protein